MQEREGKTQAKPVGKVIVMVLLCSREASFCLGTSIQFVQRGLYMLREANVRFNRLEFFWLAVSGLLAGCSDVVVYYLDAI